MALENLGAHHIPNLESLGTSVINATPGRVPFLMDWPKLYPWTGARAATKERDSRCTGCKCCLTVLSSSMQSSAENGPAAHANRAHGGK